MSPFPLHTVTTAPKAAQASLQALHDAFGFTPNIAAVMATSPVLIGGLVGLFGQVHGGSFNEAQIQTVLLTDAVANASSWAVAFHSALALQNGVSAADVQAIRASELPQAHTALSALARQLIEQRGQLQQAEIDAFLRAGFEPAQLLEVITIVAASTITNYTANVTRPPLEAAFQPHVWQAH